MIKVMTSGVFDTLHLGHINILTRAKQQGEYLIVGIQDDESVKKSKGRYPTLNFDEREKQVKALPFVDEIVKYSDVDQRGLWSQIKPDIVVQGDDYVHSGDRTKALLYLKEQNIRLMLFPRTEGISSTEIKQRIIHDDRKDIEQIKNSIKKFNEYSLKEKDSLSESIEMFWLNAGIQKKKQDVKAIKGKSEQISRIRQLLAAAWSEDLKD